MGPIAGGIILFTIILVEIGSWINRRIEARRIRNAKKEDDNESAAS